MVNNFENPWDSGRQGGRNQRPNEDPISALLNRLKTALENTIQKKNGGGWGDNSGPSGASQMKILFIAFLAVFLIWSCSGFFLVQPNQQGVVLRLGKFNRYAPPGLNYRLPYPLEMSEIVSITNVNIERLVAGADRPNRLNKDMGNLRKDWDNQMLTVDENIISIDFDVQWVIKSAKDFLFNVRDLPNENTIKAAAESAIREVIAVMTLSESLAEKRNEIESRAKSVLQSMLDNYGMGVEIVRLQLLRVEPPAEVLKAYRDVQSAKADKEKSINEAFAYANDILPKAKGEASRILNEAEAQKTSLIVESQGMAGRFESVYEQYSKAKDITQKRIYLETMESILSKLDKVILGSKIGGVLPHMALQDFRNAKIRQDIETKIN